MLDKLRIQCDKLLCTNKTKYNVIKNILKNDNCFFEMSVQVSFSILRDLGVKEEDLVRVYTSLVQYDNFV